MSERIQKVLAQHGLGSRREVERWIAEGRIRINGVMARTGDRYAEGDRVLLDERDITRRLERTPVAQVVAYHKPQGQPIARQDGREDGQPAVETPHEATRATRTEVNETAEERLPALRGSRWLAINPMHPGDSGLLLFTNDGALSYALTRQKKRIPATYMVRVHVRGGVAAAPVIPTILHLDGGVVEFTEVTVSASSPDGDSESGNIWYKVVLPRADKRAAVRALFASHNLSVSRMMQVAFGDIELTRDMARSRHVALKPAQIERLYTLAQMKLPTNAPSTLTRLQRSARVRGATQADEPVKAPGRGTARPQQRAALRRGASAKRAGRSVNRTTGRASGSPTGRSSDRPTGRDAGRPTGRPGARGRRK